MPRPRGRARAAGSQPEAAPEAFGMMVKSSGRWLKTSDVPILFANQLWVQFVEGDFLLTFGHNELPYERMTEQLQQQIEREGVDIQTVCRLAVSGEKLGAMIQVLSGLYERFTQSQKGATP